MENDIIIINSQTTLSLPWPEGNEEVPRSQMCYTDILTPVLFSSQPGSVQSEAYVGEMQIDISSRLSTRLKAMDLLLFTGG